MLNQILNNIESGRYSKTFKKARLIHNDIFTTNRKKKPNLKFVHYTLYNITLYNGPLVQSV